MVKQSTSFDDKNKKLDTTPGICHFALCRDGLTKTFWADSSNSRRVLRRPAVDMLLVSNIGRDLNSYRPVG